MILIPIPYRLNFLTIISYYNDRTDFRAFDPDTSVLILEKQNLETRVINFSIKEDVRYKISDASWLSLGMTASLIPSKVNFISQEKNFFCARTEFPRFVNFDKKYLYYTAYLQNSSKLTQKIHLRVGVRYDYSTLIKDGAPSPRFSIWYQINDRTSIAGSWGIFYQYPDLLSIYTRDPPVDLSKNLDLINAEKSTHYLFSIKRTLPSNMVVKLGFYYKDLERLLMPEDNEFYIPHNTGLGVSEGVEFELNKSSSGRERLSGFISYSFGSSKYCEINSNKWVPFKFDQRHRLTLLANIRLWGNWRASFLWQVASGLPFTDIIGIRSNPTYLNDWDFVRGPQNEAKLPYFHRLDARLNYQHWVGNRLFSFYLDFINLTNRSNIYDILWDKEYIEESKTILRVAKKRTIYMLPFFPSFGVSFKL
ncbi:MAG: TonB-dependent receptor plug domain-containing protein [bacterium]